MSCSDYLNVKKKLVLYNSLSERSTNNTNITSNNYIPPNLLQNKKQYYTTREELSGALQVNRYETCINKKNETIFENENICNVKIIDTTKTIYALQSY